MNALATRGAAVSADVLLGDAAAAAAILTGLAAVSPQGRAALRRRRQRKQDLDGTPPRIVEVNGRKVTVDPGRPPLAALVQELVESNKRIEELTAQLARNSGSTVADKIHEIAANLEANHRENRQDISEIRRQSEENADALGEVRRLAGEAATRAANADQRVRERSAELDVFMNAVREDNAAIWASLHDIGADRRVGGEE